MKFYWSLCHLISKMLIILRFILINLFSLVKRLMMLRVINDECIRP